VRSPSSICSRVFHLALIYPKCRGSRQLRLDPLDERRFRITCRFTYEKARNEKLTPERLQQFGFAYAPPLIISAAVNNKVFDALEGGPKTVEQLKKETGASARGLRAIMDALVGLELLKKDRQSRYSLTPESQAFLISEKPGTLAGFFGSILPIMTSRWLRLTDIVRDGRPAVAVNQETEGTEFFSQLVETIIPMSYPAAQKLADHLKVAKAKGQVRVIDLAAGSGIWGIAVAQKSPRVTGDGSRLGGDDSHNETHHSKIWCARSLRLHRRRPVASELWPRLRCRDAGAYSAQRRRTTKSSVAQENFSRFKIRRHNRHRRMAGK